MLTKQGFLAMEYGMNDAFIGSILLSKDIKETVEQKPVSLFFPIGEHSKHLASKSR